MTTVDESPDSNSPRDDSEADRRAIEDDSRADMRDIQLAPSGTREAGQGVATSAPPVADIEREMDRRRIALQILAVVVPWRDALRELDVAECDLFRARAHALLNYLDVAVMPHPDLQDALAAARSELATEWRNIAS